LSKKLLHREIKYDILYIFKKVLYITIWLCGESTLPQILELRWLAAKRTNSFLFK